MISIAFSPSGHIQQQYRIQLFTTVLLRSLSHLSVTRYVCMQIPKDQLCFFFSKEVGFFYTLHTHSVLSEFIVDFSDQKYKKRRLSDYLILAISSLFAAHGNKYKNICKKKDLQGGYRKKEQTKERSEMNVPL